MEIANHSQRSAATPLLLILFVATRLLLFTNFQLGSEIERAYSKPAQEVELGARHGVSFYDYHAQWMQKRIEQARREGRRSPTEEMKRVEYPPLSIVFMYLPTLVAGESAEAELDHPGDWTVRYVLAYRVLMAIVDVLVFLLLARLIPRLFPDEGPAVHQERLAVYVLCGVVLGHMLYDRLDLVLGGLLLLALALLVSRTHYGWSFVALAAAVNFKVIPVILFPVWVLLSLRSQSLQSVLRLIAGCIGRSLLIVGLTVGFTVPFLLLYGSKCLDFLSFHQERGLQVESVPSSILITLAAFGCPVQFGWGHGGYELTASLAPFVARLSTAILALLLLAATARLAFHFRQLAKGNTATVAQSEPGLAVQFTLLFLMTAVAGSKVFSPQFLLVLLPLLPLAPLANRPRRWLQGGFLVVTILTTAIFPYLYLYIHICYPLEQYPIAPVAGNLAVVSGGLVVARNAIFVTLTAMLWVWTWRGKFSTFSAGADGL